MVKQFFARAGVATAMIATCVSGAANAAYDTNATTVISNVVNEAQSVATVTAITSGFTGGGSGGTAGLFGGGGFGGGPVQTGHIKTTQRGMSAGGKESRLAVWVNGAYSTFDEDQSALDSDGDVVAVAAGADWRFTERFIGGLSAGYQVSDINTTFNTGSLESDGVFIAPYFAMQLTDNIFLDASVGYTTLETDVSRVSAGTAITGSYDSSQTFGSVNLTTRFARGKLAILPSAGVLYTRQTSDSYTESNGAVIPENTTKLGRLRAGARLQYQVNDKVAPYVRGDIEYDFVHDDITVAAGQTQPSYHDTGAVLGAGVVMNLSERIRATVDGSTVLGKSDFTQYNLTGNLRFSF